MSDNIIAFPVPGAVPPRHPGDEPRQSDRPTAVEIAELVAALDGCAACCDLQNCEVKLTLAKWMNRV